MVAGSSNQGIADALMITLRAVEKYVSSIFDKLGVPAGPADSRRVLAVLQRACAPDGSARPVQRPPEPRRRRARPCR